MCRRLILVFSLFLILFSSCGEDRTEDPIEDIVEDSMNIELSFLQLNVWVECTKVDNAPQYLIEQIAYLNPDVATFCELYKGEGDNPVLPQLVDGLAAKGLNYYSARIEGRAVLSKYPIIETERINKWMFKAVLNIKGQRITIYPSHSEYRYYSCYYPRGYNDGSSNWEKLPTPITDVDVILAVNRKSGRIESTQTFIQNAEEEIEKGAFVFFAGDFNEPSHLDWQDDTKNLRDHRGCVVDWDVSLLLYNNGFKDAYREFFPDAVNYPGFTFPADNKNVDVSSLTWAPDADERERIDFIYYYPNDKLSIKDASIAGPSGSIVKSERVEENSSDVFVSNGNSGWPSDHKGVLITFVLKQ